MTAVLITDQRQIVYRNRPGDALAVQPGDDGAEIVGRDVAVGQGDVGEPAGGGVVGDAALAVRGNGRPHPLMQLRQSQIAGNGDVNDRFVSGEDGDTGGLDGEYGRFPCQPCQNTGQPIQIIRFGHMIGKMGHKRCRQIAHAKPLRHFRPQLFDQFSVLVIQQRNNAVHV